MNVSGSGARLRSNLVNPAALGYLALVLAVVGWVAVDILFVEHQGVSFVGVWLFVVTAPVSWIFLMLPGPMPLVGIVVGAVVQAAAIGAMYRAARRGRGTGAAAAER